MSALRNRFVLAGSLGWMGAVLVADLMTPLGVAEWAFYVPAILMAALPGRPRTILMLTVACTGLTIAGLFLSPPGVSFGWGAANRAMGLLILWLTAFAATAITRRSHQLSETLTALRKEAAAREQSEAQLRELTARLEQRVLERTVELEEKQRRTEAIMQTAAEGIITIDDRGVIDSINPAAEKIFGYAASEVVGRNVSVLMPSPDREQHDAYIANYLRTGQAKIIGIGREVVARRKDGTLFPMDLSVSEVKLKARRLFTALVRDISERRELELAVAAAAEQERARIARELHDGLGQQLGGLLFLMDGLHRDLRDARAPQAETAVQLGQELGTALTQARNLAHELYSVAPTAEGLAEALENLAGRVAAERGFACEFVSEPAVLINNPTAASHLYRLAQEAVHNALKHSAATRIRIELTRRPDAVELKVRDNGTGFTPQPGSHGLGLRTMEQRARLMSGRLKVHTPAGGGVEVICSVPASMVDGTRPG